MNNFYLQKLILNTLLAKIKNRLIKIKKKISLSFYNLFATLDDLDSIHLHLRGENQDYNKFIVLGYPRTGTSMVISTLRKHPQIVGFGEIFMHQEVGLNLNYDYNFFDLDKILAIRNKYPLEFLDSFIFTSYRSNLKAVGFKLFPHQMDNHRFKSMWQWLETNKEMKIILLTRKNWLASYSSYLIAKKDNNWWVGNPSHRTKSTVYIEPDNLSKYFSKRIFYDDKIMNHIRFHQILEINYEEMSKYPDHTFRMVQDFLETDILKLKVSSVKKEIRPLSEVIENFEELKASFSGTKYENFFYD